MIEELFSKRKTTKKVIILKKYMDVRLNTIERNLQGNNTIEYLEYISRELSDLILIERLGIYLQMLFPKSKFQTKLLMIAGTSLCLEIAQYVLAVGRTDITDLITNTAGGFLGLALYGIVNRLLKDRAKTDKLFFVIAVVVSVLFVGLLAVLLLTNQ